MRRSTKGSLLPCSHSACGQNYIDTGDVACILPPRVEPRALLAIDTHRPGEVTIIRHHPSATTPRAKLTGYIVARVIYQFIDGAPSDETLRYAHEMAAAPQLLEVLERVWAHWAGGDVPEDLERDIPRVLKLARNE